MLAIPVIDDPVGLLRDMERLVRRNPAYATDPTTRAALAQLQRIDPDGATAWISRIAAAARMRTHDLARHIETPRESSFEMIGYSYAQAIAREICAPPYLIKGLLNEGELTFVFGDSGTMKSFVVTDLAYHVAKSKIWHGFPVGKPRAVLIVLGEGQAGYIKRLHALHRKHGDKDLPIYVWPAPITMDENADVLACAIDETEKLLGMPVGLVILDTFSLMLGALEESSNHDVAVAGSNVMAAAAGRAVLFVHHTGHGDKSRERGAYQIRAMADNRILVTRDDNGKGRVVTVSGEKCKDGELFEPFNLTYEVVEVGTDQDGDPVTSCVMVSTDLDPVGSGPAKRNKARDYLMTAMQVTGNNQREVVRKQFLALYPADHEASRKAFNRAWSEYMNEVASVRTPT